MSGYLDQTTPKAARLLPAPPLRKPFTPLALLQAVRAALDAGQGSGSVAE